MACTAVALANATDVCAYARSACAETGAGIFGSYITLWHCEMDGGWGWFLPLSAWLIVLIYALGTTADGFLIPQLAYLSTLLKLSPDVAGVTLLALGNGAPDVFTGIAVATQRGETLDFSLLLSDIVGGSVFMCLAEPPEHLPPSHLPPAASSASASRMPRLCVGRSMTVVVGAVVWIANRHEPGWQVEMVPFWRDVVGLVIALTAVAAVAADGTVVLWESLSFLGLCAPSRLEPASPAPPASCPFSRACSPRARHPAPVIPRLRPLTPADAPPLRCRRPLRDGRAVLARPAALLLRRRGCGGRGWLGHEVAAAAAPCSASRCRASRAGVGVRAFGPDLGCGFGRAAAHDGLSGRC